MNTRKKPSWLTTAKYVPHGENANSLTLFALASFINISMLREEGNDDELEEVVGAFEDADAELFVFVDEFDNETKGELVVLPIVILRTGFLAT